MDRVAESLDRLKVALFQILGILPGLVLSLIILMAGFFIARTLERLGYRVTPVASGHAALEIFAKSPMAFAAIITDLKMPRMSGLMLVDRLRAIRPGIPVVLCTGYADAETEQRIVALGASALLAKPPTARTFADTLRLVLRQRA